jgi:hypothetical protein
MRQYTQIYDKSKPGSSKTLYGNQAGGLVWQENNKAAPGRAAWHQQ